MATLSASTIQNTDLLAQMNAGYGASEYINQAVSTEQSRMSNLDAWAKRDVYRLRGQSLGTAHTEDRCRFLTLVTRVVLLASIIVVAVVSATSQNSISRRTGIILAVSVVLTTGAGLLALVAIAATRRNDAWGHYYWKTGTTVRGANDPAT